jgi:hypothetical protein
MPYDATIKQESVHAESLGADATEGKNPIVSGMKRHVQLMGFLPTGSPLAKGMSLIIKSWEKEGNAVSFRSTYHYIPCSFVRSHLLEGAYQFDLIPSA